MARRNQAPLFAADGALVQRTRPATDKMIAELRRNELLEGGDVALVAMLRTLADLIDHELAAPDPNKWAVAQLCSRWLDIHQIIRAPSVTAIDAELAAFFTGDPATPVRDPTKP